MTLTASQTEDFENCWVKQKVLNNSYFNSKQSLVPDGRLFLTNTLTPNAPHF